MPGFISSDGNRILISGDFTIQEMPRVVAAMHNTVINRGYQDITLDFRNCTRAFAGPMLGVVTRVQKYWSDGIDITLELPEQNNLRRLFLNTNWANLIDFRQYPESTFRGYRQVPAKKFTDAAEQTEAVSGILKILLSALSNFDRADLRAIEWAINEITDNVINHSNSPVGGFVQVSNFPGSSRRVEFAVCDAGIGIPETLRATHPEIPTDHEALDRAIREGVTRDKAVGQGNGLYGTWRITEFSEGRFEIYSAYASLISSHQRGLHIRSEQIPFNGTLVIASINYAQPIDLSDALLFEGKKHVPVDYIELEYEEDESGNIRFSMANESEGFGSRAAGDPVRRKLLNLTRLIEDGRIIVDFSDVPLVSSSFADEVFGKIFVDMGPLEFSRHYDFVNVDPLVRQLNDKAITQRAAVGA